MADDDDLSFPRWLWAVMGAVLLALGVAAFILLGPAAPPPVAASLPAPPKSPAELDAERLQREQDARNEEFAREGERRYLARELQPSPAAAPTPAAAAIRPVHATLGLSLADVVADLPFVVRTTEGRMDDGRDHRVVHFADSGGPIGVLIIRGGPYNVNDLSLLVLLRPTNRANTQRVAMIAAAFLGNVVPEWIDALDWFAHASVTAATDYGNDPLKIVGDKRFRMVGMPTTDGPAVSLIINNTAD